eukprot:NODE_192_length_15450_cov_0.476355.p2 type:complete len:292 gc:universal NODE_192_length_15450_cov_0.476355:5029-4154(-)
MLVGFKIFNIAGLCQLFDRNNRKSLVDHFPDMFSHIRVLYEFLSSEKIINGLVKHFQEHERYGEITKLCSKLKKMELNERYDEISTQPSGLLLLEFVTICALNTVQDASGIMKLDFTNLSLECSHGYDFFLKGAIEMDCRGYSTLNDRSLDIEVCEIKSPLRKFDSKYDVIFKDKSFGESSVEALDGGKKSDKNSKFFKKDTDEGLKIEKKSYDPLACAGEQLSICLLVRAVAVKLMYPGIREVVPSLNGVIYTMNGDETVLKNETDRVKEHLDTLFGKKLFITIECKQVK